MSDSSQPVACRTEVFDEAQRERYRTLLNQLRGAVTEVRELGDGYEFLLTSGVANCMGAMEFATLERLCCPFLTFSISLKGSGGPLTVRLTGPAGTREVLAASLLSG